MLTLFDTVSLLQATSSHECINQACLTPVSPQKVRATLSQNPFQRESLITKGELCARGV